MKVKIKIPVAKQKGKAGGSSPVGKAPTMTGGKKRVKPTAKKGCK